jgi:hypothetical protein
VATHRGTLFVITVSKLKLTDVLPSLIVHLRLQPSQENRQLLQIVEHEDFYHPDDLMALLIPPLISVVQILLWIGTIGSIICARIFQIFFGKHCVVLMKALTEIYRFMIYTL